MHPRSLASSLVLATLCSICACISPKSSLGDLPGDSTGEAGTTGSIGSDASGEVPVDGGGVGAPCQLGVVPETLMLELGNPACGSDMCLYGDEIIAVPQQSCSDDGDCSGAGQGVICGPGGECMLDPEHIAAHSMCTDFCEVDADCVGVDGTACAQGFVCGPIQALGPVCCQKVCVCQDELTTVRDGPLAMQCEAGTQPGCCDQDPPGAGCGA